MENKKTIIHQKIDIDNKHMSLQNVQMWHNSIKKTIPENCILITTPNEITKIDGDDILIEIEAKSYTANEILTIIEKAWMYDELNK